MKILIIDDDSVSRKVAVTLLNNYGECFSCANGEEGVALFRAACNRDDPFNLVCLDIMMPGMDGQEVLTTIRAIQKKIGTSDFAICKVIMLTSLDDNRSKVEALKGRADSYIIKPMSKDILCKELELLGVAPKN